MQSLRSFWATHVARVAVLLMLVSGVSFTLSSCSSAQRSAGKTYKGEPFQGNKYRSDKKYWRAVGQASSTNPNLAKEKAMLAAKQKVATLINSTVKTVTDRYLKSTFTEVDESINESFENLTREVAKVTLNNVTIMDEVVKVQTAKVRNEEGKKVKRTLYNGYVALEVSKAEYKAAMNAAAQRAQAKQLAFDKEKFEEIFDEEMDKLDEEQGNDYAY